MYLRQTFKKQGGVTLLKQYFYAGAFFTSVFEFLLLGKSRTALEILRLSASMKTKQKLQRRYRKHIEDFERNWKDDVPHTTSDKVWICWFQGIENAPKLVQKCYQSVKENMLDREVIMLTLDNMFDYIDFPDFILDKWKRGIITHTHMTDLMRLELLIKYGGLWLDATVYCSDNHIPDYFLDSDLFLYQCLKPGRDGHSNYISSWLMEAKTNNKVLVATRELCYAYWKENNSMWDYFLLHDFMSIVLDCYPEETRKIIPRDNSAPHALLLRLFEPYDRKIWEAIKGQSQFHKLSYKFEAGKEEIKGTYFDVLFG